MYFRMHLTHNHFGVAKGIPFYKLSLKQESEAPLLRCSSILHSCKRKISIKYKTVMFTTF